MTYDPDEDIDAPLVGEPDEVAEVVAAVEQLDADAARARAAEAADE